MGYDLPVAIDNEGGAALTELDSLEKGGHPAKFDVHGRDADELAFLVEGWGGRRDAGDALVEKDVRVHPGQLPLLASLYVPGADSRVVGIIHHLFACYSAIRVVGSLRGCPG